MTNEKAIIILHDLKYQFEDCVRVAKSPNAKDFQKESLEDNEEIVVALEKAIKALSKK